MESNDGRVPPFTGCHRRDRWWANHLRFVVSHCRDLRLGYIYIYIDRRAAKREALDKLFAEFYLITWMTPHPQKVGAINITSKVSIGKFNKSLVPSQK